MSEEPFDVVAVYRTTPIDTEFAADRLGPSQIAEHHTPRLRQATNPPQDRITRAENAPSEIAHRECPTTRSARESNGSKGTSPFCDV